MKNNPVARILHLYLEGKVHLSFTSFTNCPFHKKPSLELPKWSLRLHLTVKKVYEVYYTSIVITVIICAGSAFGSLEGDLLNQTQFIT